LGNIDYPRYSHEDIARIAASFLTKHHPSGTIPVPIEKIVDNALKIDIVPIPGMHKAFDTDGFTTSDLKAIYVEEFIYDQRPGRYRFTLAHEVGHIVLHEKLYRSLKWDSLEEWKRTVQGIDEEQYRWLEWHANAFAGLVLVPPAPLEKQIRECEETILQAIPESREQPEAHRDFLEACLADAFEVSIGVISRRLKKSFPQP
jgi:Zn-dependent peptidase ImmA (M78 family)